MLVSFIRYTRFYFFGHAIPRTNIIEFMALTLFFWYIYIFPNKKMTQRNCIEIRGKVALYLWDLCENICGLVVKTQTRWPTNYKSGKNQRETIWLGISHLFCVRFLFIIHFWWNYIYYVREIMYIYSIFFLPFCPTMEFIWVILCELINSLDWFCGCFIILLLFCYFDF